MKRRRQDDEGRWLARSEGRSAMSLGERQAVLSRDGWCCKKCSFCSPTGEALDVHHIVDVSMGGSDDLSNLDTLCAECHGEWTWCRPPGVSYETWLRLPPARWLSLVWTMTPMLPGDMSAREFADEAESRLRELRAEQIAKANWSAAADLYTPRRRDRKRR
jgi:hypothetical protein